MSFWHSLNGMIEVRITSASPEITLSAIGEENIPVFQVRSIGDLTVSFRIPRQNLPQLKALAEKRGDNLQLTGYRGIHWTLRSLLRRPVLLGGIACLILSALVIPRFVFFVEVDGNAAVADNRILEAAEICGIRFGARRAEVRSEQVKNALLSEVPELQWAGVNTRGCTAIISVRERSPEEKREEEHRVSSIVALRDGVILSCTATRGTLVCAEGQAVHTGELLISGYTDCGFSIQATEAQGEIFAQTIRKIRVLTPDVRLEKGAERDRAVDISLLVGKKRINLWKDSGIWDSSCGRMYKEYYVTLPGGFTLPLAVCVETITDWEMQKTQLPQETAEAMLAAFSKSYLSRQMIAGEILQSDLALSCNSGGYVLEGSFLCREMIGGVRIEKMGEAYGETD